MQSQRESSAVKHEYEIKLQLSHEHCTHTHTQKLNTPWVLFVYYRFSAFGFGGRNVPLDFFPPLFQFLQLSTRSDLLSYSRDENKSKQNSLQNPKYFTGIHYLIEMIAGILR